MNQKTEVSLPWQSQLAGQGRQKSARPGKAKRAREDRSQKAKMYILVKNVFFLFSVFCFLFSATGCEAMRKKFTRKPKKEAKVEEVIYVPEEYPASEINRDEFYKIHFMLWQNWHDELVARLEMPANKKKWIDCIDEEIKNILILKDIILSEEKKLLIDDFIKELYEFKNDIGELSYITLSEIYHLKTKIESFGRRVHRDLSYSKIREHLVGNYKEEK